MIGGRAGSSWACFVFMICGLADGASAQAVGPADRGVERPAWFDVAWPGAALGGGGFVIGAFAGAGLADCSSTDDGLCELGGAFLGAATLGTIGLATGVHLGNDRRGNYGVDLLTAAGLWAATIGVLAATGWDDTATTVGFVALPIGQLLATVAVERALGDERARERDETADAKVPLEVGIGPARGGAGLSLAGRIRF